MREHSKEWAVKINRIPLYYVQTKLIFYKNQMCLHMEGMRKELNTVENFQSKMQKEMIIKNLKKRGCRLTKQRLTLIDIILENNCASCKEIHYKASKIDHKIGVATAYRMIRLLEEIGAISRGNLYKLECAPGKEQKNVCKITLEDGSIHPFLLSDLDRVVNLGMRHCNYFMGHRVVSVELHGNKIGWEKE